MATKVYDFGNKGVTLSVDIGELGKVVFTKGRAVVDKEEKQDALEKWLEATSLGMYTVHDYDPTVDAQVINTVPGTQQANHLVNGIMTSMGSAGINTSNPVADMLDSQLAQAVVTGQVDALIEANPEILADAGFVANTENSAKPAPVKPVLGKSK